MNYEIETIGLEAEKTNEKFNLVEDALQKFQEEMHSDYFELLRCNRDLNEGIKEMERATQSANQMYNKISIELKDNKSALKEKMEKLKKLEAANKANTQSKKLSNLDDTMVQMDSRMKKLNDSKVNFCIYKEIFG